MTNPYYNLQRNAQEDWSYVLMANIKTQQFIAQLEEAIECLIEPEIMKEFVTLLEDLRQEYIETQIENIYHSTEDLPSVHEHAKSIFNRY